LYTTPAYKLINDFLRNLSQATSKDLLEDKNTWVATITHLNSAVRKLSKIATNYPIAFRGVGRILKPNFFVPDKRGMIAATEYGFMSTSLNKSDAISFMGNKNATFFKLKCRCEDPSGFHMGASLEWCSVYPTEKEILFPPFTLFEVHKRKRKDMITTITVSPTYV